MKEETEKIYADCSIDEKYRVYASLSFAVLLLLIGVPLWWQTTTVPRVSLPYAGIDKLSELDVKIRTRIIIAVSNKRRGESLAKEFQSTFENPEIYNFDIVLRVISREFLNEAFTHQQLEKLSSNFNVGVGEVLLLEATNFNNSLLVGAKRAIYFSPETDNALITRVLSEWILREKSLSLTKNALAEPTLYSLDKINRRRFPSSPAYDVLLTFVNPQPERINVDWDLQSIAKGYIEPFLEELSILSNFSVKSQWLYLVPLGVSLTKIPDSSPLGSHYALMEDSLPQLITPLEKKLASQVSLHPCVNLVVYLVPCEKAPLHIYMRKGHTSQLENNVEALLSPRWGGVVLTNPPKEACEMPENETVTIVPEESTIVGTAIAQLKLLLGIPEINPIKGATPIPLIGASPRNWELDGLLRIRSVEQLTSAKLTLQSLAQLLQEIGNIVITEVVGNQIKDALKLVENSAIQLERGNLSEAFILSKRAFVIAETAFSDPSLLALLYFPQDQKYAVYIPLFLPAMIPVLMSLDNIFRYFFPRGKKLTDGKDDERKIPEAEEISKAKTE